MRLFACRCRRRPSRSSLRSSSVQPHFGRRCRPAVHRFSKKHFSPVLPCAICAGLGLWDLFQTGNRIDPNEASVAQPAEAPPSNVKILREPQDKHLWRTGHDSFPFLLSNDSCVCGHIALDRSRHVGRRAAEKASCRQEKGAEAQASCKAQGKGEIASSRKKNVPAQAKKEQETSSRSQAPCKATREAKT
jgi:hypothetical protein